jgi:hypothetical protein
MGRDSASSAQSKRVGTGVEHGDKAGDGGRKTAAAGNSGTLAVVEDAGGSETARLRVHWNWLGCTGGGGAVGGERGPFLGAGGIVGGVVDDVGQQGNDVNVVCDVAVDGVGSGHLVGGLGVVVRRSGGRGAVGVVCDVAELVGA